MHKILQNSFVEHNTNIEMQQYVYQNTLIINKKISKQFITIYNNIKITENLKFEKST